MVFIKYREHQNQNCGGIQLVQVLESVIIAQINHYN